jgi:LysR family transcriptional regulator, nod-box dependent transcriptional activator
MARFNLNSYFALDAILNAATLTEAARTVHLSQPAMSLALKKLRELFGDELVRYEYGRAERTPLAEQLRPQIAEILRLSQGVLDQSRVFDPQTAVRTLRLAAPDFVLAFFLPKLIAHLLGEAPNFSLEALSFPLVPGDTGRADVYIIPDWLASGEEASFTLFREPIGCACAAGAAADQLAQSSYLDHEHVALPQQQDELFWPEGHPAREMLGRRRIVALARDLDLFQQMVIERGLVVTTFMRLAQRLATTPLVVSCLAPVQFTPVTLVAQAATGRGHEPAIRWFLRQITQVAHKKISGALPICPPNASIR